MPRKAEPVYEIRKLRWRTYTSYAGVKVWKTVVGCHQITISRWAEGYYVSCKNGYCGTIEQAKAKAAAERWCIKQLRKALRRVKR